MTTTSACSSSDTARTVRRSGSPGPLPTKDTQPRPVEAAESIAPVSLIYKAHVALGLTLFVLFPFTRLVHMVSAPIWYLGRRYQIVRQKY